MEAKISEIFLSYQGEGPFSGSRQLFIRFYGCNLSCVYCDTMLGSYKSFPKEGLLGKILDFEDDYNELTLTGGEPLLHADFLKDFLPLFKKHRKHEVYLETNGTMPDELKKIVDYVDIVAMDFKLPSFGGGEGDLLRLNEEFVKVVSDKELIIKTVITDSTSIDDIKIMGRALAGIKKDITIVLQPVTPVNEQMKEPDREMLSYFKSYVKKETDKEVIVMGQVHHCLGIK